MGLTRTIFIIIAIAVIAIIAVDVAQYIFGFSLFTQEVDYSSKAAGSTVYVQNGVSGIVTLTDPYQGKIVNITVNYDPIDSGSGVIVSNNGYIITAYHVISDPESMSSDYELKLMNSTDIQYYLEEAAVSDYMSHYNPQFANQVIYNNTTNNTHINSSTNMDTVITVLNQKNMINTTSYKQDIKVKLPSSNTFLNANLIAVGDPTVDEDIALLKVNGNNLPALTINSGEPGIGEFLRIYGYPGNSTESAYYNSSVSPSSSSGYLQSEISTSSNTNYYEDSAAVSEGYSGGPVINDENKVLGIVIYSVATENKFRQSNNTTQSSVFLSSQYITQICKENNVPITSN